MKSFSFTSILLLVSIGLTGVISAPLTSHPTWKPAPIEWKREHSADGPLDWANFTVPLNWEDPHGKTIDLAILRIPATTTSNNAKNLFLNPGGPGVGAIDMFKYHVLSNDTKTSDHWGNLRQHYNLIIPDPRGVALSTPVQCDKDLLFERHYTYPQTQEDFDKLIERNKVLGENCLNRTGDLLYHVDTVSVVQDFDAIRQALGDENEKMNYMGFSYGTAIGQTYAELFPGNVGRFVLDGVVDYWSPLTYKLEMQTRSFDSSFNRFVEWCQTTTECELHGKDVFSIFDKTINDADKTPIPALGCNGTNCLEDAIGDDILGQTYGYLTAKGTWPKLSKGVAQAAEGNATILSTPTVSFVASIASASRAVVCSDWAPWSSDIANNLDQQHLVKSVAKHTRGGWVQQRAASCVGWPVLKEAKMHRPKSYSAALPPMLLVNSLYDVATAYTWAVAVQAQIPGSVLLTRDGDGHCSYFGQGEEDQGESARLMDRFLIDGIMPRGGVVVDS